MSYRRKIVDFPELLPAIRAAQAEGRAVVMCHGCFDIVHPGHVRYLEFARRQGELLLVTLTGDSHVDKGPDRPYIPEELRAENLAALECVDLVYVSTQPDAAELLAELRPDVYVKGREYEHRAHTGFACERDVVEGYGGRVIYSSGEVVFSSTQLMAQAERREEVTAGRLEWLCERHEIDRAGLESVVRQFAGKHVVVVGDLVLDRYVACDADEVASEAPIMSLRKLGEAEHVGGAAIVARHIAALGGSACLLSAVGHDAAGDRARNVLDDEHVEHHLLEIRETTATKTRFHVDDTKLFKLDEAECSPLDSRAEMDAASYLTRQTRDADAVIFCDFGCGMLTGGLLNRVMPTISRTGTITTADVSGSRSGLTRFSHVDLLTPTERELRSALPDFEEGLSTAAWKLLERTQARHLFVTLGKRGVVVFQRASQDPRRREWSGRLRSEHLPSFATHVADGLGCGDAMLAASTLALSSGANPVQAAYLGSAAAAIELTRPGNVPVERDALHRWFNTRVELLNVDYAPTVEPARAGETRTAKTS